MSRGKKLSQLHMLTESFGLALHHVPYERLVHPITRVVYVQLSVWMDCLQKNTFAGKFKPKKSHMEGNLWTFAKNLIIIDSVARKLPA